MELIKQLLPLLLMGLTSITIPLITKFFIDMLKSNKKLNEHILIKEAVFAFVRYASELLGANTNRGEEKHKLVKDLILKNFPNVTDEQADVWIKSCVKSLKEGIDLNLGESEKPVTK